MTLYKNVTSKPWETRGLLGGLSPQPSFAMPSAKVALILFMVVATVLFSLFAITYYLRMTLGDWVPMENPSQLWLNTALLVLSSVVFQWTRARLERNPAADVRLPFLIGGGLALAFVLGQLLVWGQLNGRGLYLSNDPAAAFFYLLTGMHVLLILDNVEHLIDWVDCGCGPEPPCCCF